MSNWTLPVLVLIQGHNFYDIECIVLLPTTLMYVCHVFLAFSQSFAFSSKCFSNSQKGVGGSNEFNTSIKSISNQQKVFGI